MLLFQSELSEQETGISHTLEPGEMEDEKTRTFNVACCMGKQNFEMISFRAREIEIMDALGLGSKCCDCDFTKLEHEKAS